MKSSKLTIVLATILTFSHKTVAKSYKNHKVVSFDINNEVQLKEMQSLEGLSGVRLNRDR